jgi:pimeloyl-ACP methyl ester carboxylesterase
MRKALSRAQSISTSILHLTVMTPTLLERISGVTIPTLVLRGESDQIVEPAYGRAYAAAIAGARFEVHDRAPPRGPL